MASAGAAIPAHAALPALHVRVLLNGRNLLSSRNCRGAISRIPSLSPGALRLGKSPPARRMTVRAARTESGGIALGFRAPEFEVMFLCNHCPFVKHLKKDIVKLANFYMQKNLAIVAISSNSVETHPQDGPKLMAEEAKLFGYPFPYLYDESQDVARAFGAVCTPEFLLFKKDGRRPFELFYHGQFDDSRPGNGIPVTGRDLSLAIDCVLSGQPLSAPQKPSVGCSIKWHPGK
ncbi:uncharacterized protein LOC116267210 isoform X2 [Nymphaea colorata]|uniref:uncharacterized protein LOC116267210 isoform X2 n=1 Tax=Nymphaea colorata TaxID=210225 RepID=UPI00214F478F|nr:uncharacterized protein LOC116267210 isoform X2 [Nymphaea colorata]